MDELVGNDGLDVVAPAGCSSVHIERSASLHHAYDVTINGHLHEHLSKHQIEGLHLDKCAADVRSGTSGNPQHLQPIDTRKVVRHDNHRELAQQSVDEVEHRSLTDLALDATLSDLERRSPKPQGSFGISYASPLQKDFDARVARHGRTVTELKDFNPPGWEQAGKDHKACYKLADKGAAKTASPRETPIGGGGVYLYQSVAQNMATNKEASALALEQIKAHIDAGKAVIAGVNVPAIPYVIDPVHQPVTDHFVDICGYETDNDGKVTALFARDNALPHAPTIRMEVNADGSIVKPGSVDEKTEHVADMEYQLSEVRFHTSMPYTGGLRPLDDARDGMTWWP
ncbi:MAG TPA: hypothetical protein VLW55_11430 [Burkholderiaceae bacterium]|nr:hypothetical protein [Burkholderiaceae bacterium]